MEKEAADSVKKIADESSLLRHLVLSLDEAEQNLEEAYRKRDVDKFNAAKKFISGVQNKLTEALK
ncbi:MAG: hypothetical protein M1165_01555 [Candidatus Pacearchaeota archaeon]|nr:hypothetical protein [Candidatus Pacearchaeota archaeon]MDE1848653.1 hypothetical protein [Nanoarchaeota archaeon]